jgi:putative transposase
VSAFVDDHRDRFGVEPICRTLEVSASAYYERAKGERSRSRSRGPALARADRRDPRAQLLRLRLPSDVDRLRREGEEAGRGRVQRLMRETGIQGAKRRGKAWRTIKPDPDAHRRPDLVERDFSAEAPNRLWVGDFTYLRSWEGATTACTNPWATSHPLSSSLSTLQRGIN